MSRIRTRGEDVRRFILEHLEKHPAGIAKEAASRFRITRQAVNKHLQKLVSEGSILEAGQTRNRTYKLAPLAEWQASFKVDPELAEDVVWSRNVSPALGSLPENVSNIWHYGFTEMFNNAIDHSGGSSIRVKVSKTADGANAKTFRIATVTNLTNIKYEEWVANNRDSVDKATNGQIAYVHIRAMDQPSLERFQNEIDRFWQKKGIIVDIRNNGGGNIDQELLDILERQPYEFWNNRNGSRTWGRRPRQAIVGPKVMMINYRSVSDAEVTPQGFRTLGLGKLVGNPTSAQVIATGSYALINGGAIRTPGSLVVSWDPAKPNNYGFDLENYGIPPDVWVKNSPDDDAKGVDRELKVAIDEAMKMLKAGPKVQATQQQR